MLLVLSLCAALQTGLLTIAAVLTSLYSAVTVALGALVLGEEIGTRRAVGLVLAAAAVAAIAST